MLRYVGTRKGEIYAAGRRSHDKFQPIYCREIRHRMKLFFAAVTLVSVSLAGTSCSLVTVPVKAVGSVATATVTATGDVVTAPFDAVSGRERRREKREREKEEKKKGKDKDRDARRAPPATEYYSGGYYPRAEEVRE